ncbi:MAG: SUMF1/EgtB/PvdO family nonheme iron enzyme [Gemmatimonadota bacterium]
MYSKRTSRSPLVTSAALVLLALALVQCSRRPEAQIEGRDGQVMLLMPAGEFMMGGTEQDLEGVPGRNYLNFEAERPRHRVSLSAYYLDRTEVTNAQYRRFLKDIEGGDRSRYAHPDQPADADYLQRYVTAELLGDDQPAVGVNWFDAYAYCRWAGKRLPTEAEWEHAARGSGEEYRTYPWGNEPPDGQGIWWANYRPESGADQDGFRSSAPVGAFPDGVSPFGILDLAGNAEEWVQDWYSVNYYRLSDGAQDPPGPAAGTKRVIKGGSYEAPAWHIRTASRFWGRPGDNGPRIGFRCARSVD